MRNMLYQSKYDIETKGFTMIEILIVISIIVILSAVSSVSLFRYIDRSKEVVCVNNRNSLMRHIEGDLLVKEEIISDPLIDSYLQNWNQPICPSGGIISVVDLELQCSIHYVVDEDDDDEEVPFLYAK